MSAALGAVLDEFTSNLNRVYFESISPQIEAILLKNDFHLLWRAKSTDRNKTTIKFQKLKPTDGKYFKNYGIEELLKAIWQICPK
ncbi:MAG: hypothetical protein IPO94_20325 [Saprospiraceae bacterium]|nr:hypothetical protein [Saprospiraceae bacterium]